MITRIAPSPTGLFHLGTARTAYFNYLEAKSSIDPISGKPNGKFILRIDDTDVERNKEEYTKVILDSLEWLDLEPDEIYYQSQRVTMYQGEAKILVNSGAAIELDNGAIALRCHQDACPEYFIDTITGRIRFTETNRLQIHEKLILLRGINKETGDKTKLGFPTYQFASVVDDYFMDISNIIRGVDHITNTPKQIAIYNSLNHIYNDLNEIPKFTHLGLIFKDKKKLSKRDGAASLLWYREQGYTKEAMLDWMLRLGWSVRVPRGDKELERIANGPISKELAIELWNKGAMKNSPCNFDIAKLNSIQKFYNSN